MLPKLCYTFLFFLGALFLGLTEVSVAETLFAKVNRHNICNFKKEYRSIRVQVYGPNQCEAIYTKVGQDQRLGRGVFIASCEKIFNNVITNLENAGWSCRDAFGSQFSIESLET